LKDKSLPAKATVFYKISDEAVKEKTRRTWKQWFSILDAFDVAETGHKLAAKHLLERYKLDPWWSQAVVIRYEWERGLRVIKNQRTVWPKHKLFREKKRVR
jgi:hypothetical protein